LGIKGQFFFSKLADKNFFTHRSRSSLGNATDWGLPNSSENSGRLEKKIKDCNVKALSLIRPPKGQTNKTLSL